MIQPSLRLHRLVSLCAGQKPSPSSHFAKYVKSFDRENLKKRRKLKSSERKQTSNLSALSLPCNLNWSACFGTHQSSHGAGRNRLPSYHGQLWKCLRRRKLAKKNFPIELFACNLLPSLMSSLFLIPTRNAVTLNCGGFSTKKHNHTVLRENP